MVRDDRRRPGPDSARLVQHRRDSAQSARHVRSDHKGRSFYRSEVAGSDLMQRIDSRKLWLRRWDQASMIGHTYNGPGRIMECAHPSKSPSRRRSITGNDVGRRLRIAHCFDVWSRYQPGP